LLNQPHRLFTTISAVKLPDHQFFTCCNEKVGIIDAKPKHAMKKLIFTACFITLGLITHSQAQNLTYNYATNPAAGWFSTSSDAWSTTGGAPFNTNWTPGANATIDIGPTATSSAKTISFTDNTTIGNLTTTGSASFAPTLSDISARTLTFSGGTISLGTSLNIGGGVSLQGDFTVEAPLSDARFLRLLGTATAAAYNGTATINSGRFEINSNDGVVGINSNFIIGGTGTLQVGRNTGTYDLGTITINSGTLEIGVSNNNRTGTINVSQLSGSGGNIQALSRTSTGPGTTSFTLNINQSTNTTYAGNINGFQSTNSGNNTAFITLNKEGSGSLTLSGDIDLRRQTTVSAGTLLINSSNATFTNGLGTTAIQVDATLGGTGILEITSGDNVILGGTGSLQAGLAGSAGQTTFNFSSGGVLNLTDATAGSNTGWLRFDLGAATTAGTTYDTIALTGTGSLNIGTGLNFSDFNFNALAGFGAGTYTLFSTPSAITGSFGTTTGIIDGLDSTLSFSGNSLVLTVIPEPSAGILIIASMGTLLFLRRMRSRI